MVPEKATHLDAETDLASRDEIHRILIKGKFGQGNRRYGIGRILTKLASTSETAISLCFLVMHLEKWLAAIFLRIFLKVQKSFFEIGIGTLNCPYQL